MSIKRSPLFITHLASKDRAGGTDEVICDLCPNSCNIEDGYFGICGVRGNKRGKGIIPYYGFITALVNDPIEKKPLYHFKPGTRVISLGFAGCNLRCPFCQNWHISQNTNVPGVWMKPGEVISAALKDNFPSIAYTFSEPLVHAEFVLDCMELSHKHGIANVLVTNGCVNPKAAEEILKLTDAANIDLKTISPDTYQKTLGGNLKTVQDFIKLGFRMGVHIEITTLVVPGLNDSDDELNAIVRFIADLSDEIPLHLTAYRPEYRWNAPPTNPDFLKNAAKEARKILHHVHTGNI